MPTAPVTPAAAQDFFVTRHFESFPATGTLLKLTNNCSRQSLKSHVHLLHTMLVCLLSINNSQYSIVKIKLSIFFSAVLRPILAKPENSNYCFTSLFAVSFYPLLLSSFAAAAHSISVSGPCFLSFLKAFLPLIFPTGGCIPHLSQGRKWMFNPRFLWS